MGAALVTIHNKVSGWYFLCRKVFCIWWSEFDLGFVLAISLNRSIMYMAQWTNDAG